MNREVYDIHADYQFVSIAQNGAGDGMGFYRAKEDVYDHAYLIEAYVEISDELQSWRTFEQYMIYRISGNGLEAL